MAKHGKDWLPRVPQEYSLEGGCGQKEQRGAHRTEDLSPAPWQAAEIPDFPTDMMTLLQQAVFVSSSLWGL